MSIDRDDVVTSIERARAELAQAVDNLQKMPAFETGAVVFVAHALVNYITVSNATIGLLDGFLSGQQDPRVGHALDILREANTLMTRSAARLMNASAADEPELMIGELDLVQMMKRACEHYQRIADRKQIRINFDSPATSASIRTDRMGVAAALDNLLSNAVKFSPPGKQIWVRVQPEPESVECSVQDEGPGLSPEDQAKLFQKGVRLSAVPTGGEPSSGYGLAVAKALVDRVGGQIWCESQLGAGARFSIRIPTRYPQS
jgi:signal transduction histidine kinase